MTDVNGRNRTSRERLVAVVARLGDRDVSIEGGWTAAGLLGHLAFWDGFALARLDQHLRAGAPLDLGSEQIADHINAAAMPQWLDTPTAVAGRRAIAAATAIEASVAALPAEVLDRVKALGIEKTFIVDRSAHRKEHLDQIERALR
jgi:DinB family protein